MKTPSLLSLYPTVFPAVDVSDYQIRPVLWKKLRLCCVHLDLKDERFGKEIRMRYDTIQELIVTCCNGDGDIFNSTDLLKDCFRMFS